MMESSVSIHFTFPTDSQNKWQALVDGLNRNRHGAYFEEYAEDFGDQAEELVEYVLDEWEKEVERDVLNTKGSTISDGKATIQISGFRAVEPSVQPMVNFIKACGALNITVDANYDGNGS